MGSAFTNTVGELRSRPGLIIPGGIPAIVSTTTSLGSYEPTLAFVGSP